MARLYADENFPLPVVTELRRLGHDVLPMQENPAMALQVIPDEAVLSLASVDQRAVFTLNRKHFIQLHRSVPDHAGIMFAPSIPTSPASPALHVALRDKHLSDIDPRQSPMNPALN